MAKAVELDTKRDKDGTRAPAGKQPAP